jgi:hypothetical protein
VFCERGQTEKAEALFRRQPPAAPVQEPSYAWPTVADYERDFGFEVNEAFRMAWGIARTTTTPPAAQPAPAPGYCKHCEQYTIDEPLAAAQPAVPLTDEQIHTLWRNHPNRTNIVYVVRAIEAAHGITAPAQKGGEA